MKKFLVLFVAVLATLGLVACQNGEQPDNREVLVVGLEADYAPFNWFETEDNDYNYPLTGQDGYVAGYDVDIAIALAESLDMRLEIRAIEWGSLVLALQADEIDVIIAGMSPTPDRLEAINFTEAYYTANHVAVVNKNGSYANATTLNDLNGARGVGQKGTVYATIIEELAAGDYNVTALPVIDTVPLISVALVGNDADFTVVEAPVALGMVAANSNLKIVFDDVDNIFDVSDDDRVVSIGYRKADTTLGTNLDQALAKITQETRTAWMSRAVDRSES